MPELQKRVLVDGKPWEKVPEKFLVVLHVVFLQAK